MNVTKQDIKQALEKLGLEGKFVEVHSSLSSFGYVEGGATTIIDAIQEVVDTAIYPAFFEKAHILPVDYQKYKRNGLNLEGLERNEWLGMGFSFDSPMDKDLGIIPRTVLSNYEHIRSNHPTRSWIGIGKHAEDILKDHNHELNLPIKNIMAKDGYVLLVGVNLNRCTAIHLAEEIAGVNNFIRWVRQGDEIIDIRVGGDSSGFENLRDKLKAIESSQKVGEAELRVYPLPELVRIASEEIKNNPEITRCSPDCIACEDRINGGPYIE